MGSLPFIPTSENTTQALGDPIEVWRSPLDLNRLVIERPASTFFLRMTGERLGVGDGDLLVVDRSLTPVNGKLVVAVIDGDLQLARFPVVEIWGVAVWVIHKP